MAPLPVTNTARMWVDYTNSYDQHTIMWRFDEGVADQNDVMDGFVAFLTALSTSINAITLTAARWAAAGSHISTPMALPADTTYGSGALNAGARANAWEFLGRAASGRRSSFYLYAVAAAVPGNARVQETADANLAAAIAQLVLATDNGLWVAIDSTILFVKPYVNFVVNDYWTHQIRA